METGEAAYRLEIAEKRIEELMHRVEALERRPVYVPYPVFPPVQTDPNPFPPGFPGVEPTWICNTPAVTALFGVPQNTAASGAPLS